MSDEDDGVQVGNVVAAAMHVGDCLGTAPSSLAASDADTDALHGVALKYHDLTEGTLGDLRRPEIINCGPAIVTQLKVGRWVRMSGSVE
mmetsp:Transcript_89835/g.256852  ORF Transcript_89835/g.256852 Transcript_89835/m.256852 type:complete len:89 (-) Transcript_89835:151-417(-)